MLTMQEAAYMMMMTMLCKTMMSRERVEEDKGEKKIKYRRGIPEINEKLKLKDQQEHSFKSSTPKIINGCCNDKSERGGG